MMEHRLKYECFKNVRFYFLNYLPGIRFNKIIVIDVNIIFSNFYSKSEKREVLFLE